MTEVLPINTTRWCPETIMRYHHFFHPSGIYERMEVVKVASSVVQINNGRWSVLGAAIWEDSYPQVNLSDAVDGWYFIIGTYRFFPSYTPPEYSYVPAQDVAVFYETHQYSLIFKKVQVISGVVQGALGDSPGEDTGRIYVDPGLLHVVISPQDTRAGSLIERRRHVEDLLEDSEYRWAFADLFETNAMIDTVLSDVMWHGLGHYVVGMNTQTFQSRGLYYSEMGFTNITQAYVSCEFDTYDPAKTTISISNNGGTVWMPVVNNSDVMFTASTGNNLLLKVVFNDQVLFYDYTVLVRGEA